MLGTKFFDTLRKHLEIGGDIRYMNMSPDQKERVKVCMELYNLMKQNPYLNKEEYLRNKYGRTYWQIRSDKECLDFIISVLDAGGRNISRFVVKSTYEKAIRMAHDQGDVKNMISGAEKLSNLERLTEPEQGEDMENSITKLPIVLTQDARKILPGKTFSNSRQMDRIRKKWGVQKDPHQEAVDRKTEELLSSSGEGDADASGGFDLSSLDDAQLEALRAALDKRTAAVAMSAASEVEDDPFDDEDNNDENDDF